MKRIMFSLSLSVLLIITGGAEADTMERGTVQIEYERGLKSAALEILGYMPSIMERIEKRTGLPAEIPVEIVTYRRRSDFVRSAGTDLIAAYAVPRRKLIVLDLSRMSVHPLNLRMIIAHEMAHIVLHHHIGDGRIPKWFDEGVAEWISGVSELISPGKGDVLKRAAIGGRLLPFYTLKSGFPGDASGFALAYAQGLSMVEYIGNEHGEEAVRALIMRMKEGKEFRQAVRQVLNMGFSDLERSWERKVRKRYTWPGYVTNNIHWILFLAGAFVIVYGFVRLRKRMREYPDDDEEDGFDGW